MVGIDAFLLRLALKVDETVFKCFEINHVSVNYFVKINPAMQINLLYIITILLHTLVDTLLWP